MEEHSQNEKCFCMSDDVISQQKNRVATKKIRIHAAFLYTFIS